MHIFLKAGLPVTAGTGVVGAGGYYFLSNRETIGSSLLSSIKGSRKVLFSKVDKEWVEWKEVYEASKERIDSVTKDDLPKWCEDTLKLSNKDRRNYDLASKWCVVNTNTLKDELISKGVKVLMADSSDPKWQKVWKYHKDNRGDNSAIAITDSTVIRDDLIESNGAIPMHKWCTDRYSWPMYKLNSESEIVKVEKWCSVDHN